MAHSSFSRHLTYWVIPSLVTLACIIIYFFDVFGWSHLMAHPINREFGVVENLQLVLLLSIIFVSVKGVKRNHSRLARRSFRILAAFCVILVLEEIDYGLHYWDFFTLPAEAPVTVMQIDYSTEVRNLHNNGKITNTTKLLSYALIIILFVVFPLLPEKTKDRFSVLKFLSPSRLIVFTAASLLIVNNIALYFYRYMEHPNNALNGNISEFEEIMTYYIFMLYIGEMAYSQKVSMLFAHLQEKRKKTSAVGGFEYDIMESGSKA